MSPNLFNIDFTSVSERHNHATFMTFAIIRCQLKKIKKLKNWLFTFLFTLKRAGNLNLKCLRNYKQKMFKLIPVFNLFP